MTEDEDLPEAMAYVHYEIECDPCGVPFDVDHDPAGEIHTCPDCGTRMRVSETL